MFDLTDEEREFLTQEGFPFDGSVEEQKRCLRNLAKKYHPDATGNLSDEKEAITSKNKIVIIIKAMKSLRGSKEGSNDLYEEFLRNVDEKSPEEVFSFFLRHEGEISPQAFEKIQDPLFDFFDKILRSKRKDKQEDETYDKNLGEATNIAELDYDTFVNILSKNGVIFEREDGSKFLLKYDSEPDELGLNEYTCTSDGIEKDITLYTEMDVETLYKVISTPEGYKLFANIYMEKNRLQNSNRMGDPKYKDNDGMLDKDSAIGMAYTGYIRPSENNTYGPDNLKVDPRKWIYLWSRWLFDFRDGGAMFKKDGTILFKEKEQDSEDFETAFHLKYEEKVQLDDENETVVYAYTYQKSKDDEPKTLFTEMNPNALFDFIAESDDAYDYFVGTYLGDQRVAQIVESRNPNTYGENDDSYIGNGYAGTVKIGDSGFVMESQMSVQEAIWRYLQRKTESRPSGENQYDEGPDF